MEKVDIGEIPFLAAYDLSFIEDGDRQCQIAELMESDNYKVDMKKAFVAGDSQGAFYNPLFIISQ